MRVTLTNTLKRLVKFHLKKFVSHFIHKYILIFYILIFTFIAWTWDHWFDWYISSPMQYRFMWRTSEWNSLSILLRSRIRQRRKEEEGSIYNRRVGDRWYLCNRAWWAHEWQWQGSEDSGCCEGSCNTQRMGTCKGL